MRSGVIALALLLGGARALPAQAQYSLRQYLSIRGAAAPTISPDGAQVAYRTSVTGTSQVWRVNAASGWPDQLTFFPSSVGGVSWSPAGDWLLVPADNNGDENFQLHLFSPDGSRHVAITSDPKIRHNFGGWSADGKSVFYTDNSRDQRYFDCYVMDVGTKQARRVFQKDSVLSAAALSRDGKLMAAADAKSNVDVDLYIVDTATGQGRMVTPHTGDVVYNPIGFSADNRWLYLASNQDRDFVNLARIEVASGKLSYLNSDNHDIENASLSNDARTLAYTSNRDGYEELTLLDVATGRTLKMLKLPHGITSPGDFSRDGKRLALAVNTPTINGDVFVLDIAAGKLLRSTYSSLAGIDPATFVDPALIHYKTFDGTEIPAFLMMPKNAPDNHSLPVILSVHGGPEGQERPNFSPIYQYFVSRGYAVLAPNIRGSSGFGKAYLAADNGPKRWDALKDLNAAVDFIASQPQLDPKKVVVFGGSYGGFAVLAMLTHYPDRFAAGVDLFGPADFKTFLANTAPYRRPLRIAEYGDPVKDSDFLDQISPFKHADRIKAPLLIMQGAMDPRVPQSESEQMAQKVKSNGGVVEYLLFPDEGHGISKMPNRIKFFETMVAFLDKYVRGKASARR